MKKISICLCIALMFSNHAFSQIQVDSVGNVGVGTATPSAKLDVDGVIKATGGNSTDWNNKLDAEVDADTTNELQLLNLSGDTIFISNGNFIVIPNLNVLTTLNCSVSSSLSNTDETFSGAKDGSITVSSTCTGFCGTIQYSIIGGAVQTSNIFTGLAPGTYTIVATNDGIACSDTNMVTILAGPPPTVQQRLDTAETPLALFNTGIQLDSLYGKTYQGGLICYLDTLTGDGLIAALSDIPNSKRWHNGTGIVTGATDLSIGAGQSNTASIISVQGGGIYAATECTGFTSGIYTDWFLPSRAELNTMYVNLHSEGLGSFNPTLYWSSSEVNNSSAHTQDFFNGSFPSRLKGDNLRVRPCRAFSPVPPSCSISSSAGKTDETFSGFNDGSITVTASCTGSCGTIQYALNGGALQYSNAFPGLAPGTYSVVATNDGVACSDTNVITILPGPLTIQQRLDTAETPIAIFNSGSPVDSLYGKTYQGGLICHLNTTTGDGLVASFTDQGSFQWNNGSNLITGATGQAIGLGQSNTGSIISVQGAGNYAATECAGFSSGIYNDWFLPSKDELDKMYINLKLKGFGAFSSNDYWCSSESTMQNAFVVRFSNGTPNAENKFNNNMVRPCRAFSLVPPSCVISSLANKTDETFSGFNDGSITVTASCTGSCGTMEYVLNGGTLQYSNVFTGLAPGTYTVVATNDGVACSDTNLVTILAGPMSVQQRLDTAETPIAIFNSGVPLDSLFGKSYQGGLIFHLDTLTGNGLVAALSDNGPAQWHNPGGATNTGAIGQDIGDGQPNTSTIVTAQGPGSYAAVICDALSVGIYNDWFLPSKDELNEMHQNLKLNNFGSFINNSYWSSSESDVNNAFGQNFVSGTPSALGKGNFLQVRACREF